jgi:hypothetical protein
MRGLERSHYKAREPRRRVLIAARMRAGLAWADVCLLNVSSKGLLAQTSKPPCKGSYIEVRRGRSTIVARVVWTDKERFGLCTQDPVPVDELLGDRGDGKHGDKSARPYGEGDRRAIAREPIFSDRHERSRLLGRRFEFGFLLAAGALLAGSGADLIQAAVAEPMARISAALVLE